jgi:hypothetical protein
LNTRPTAGLTPSIAKKLPETISVSSRSVWLSTLTDVEIRRRAITSDNASARF